MQNVKMINGKYGGRSSQSCCGQSILLHTEVRSLMFVLSYASQLYSAV